MRLQASLKYTSLSIYTIVLLLNLTLTGCSLFSTEEPINPDDANLSVVFGYIDMGEAPSWGGLDWVTVKRYKPSEAIYRCGVEDGLFWHIGVEPGSVQVDTFGRNGRWYSDARYSYDYGGQGRNDTATVINTPGVYFVGAYAYKPVGPTFLSFSKEFDLVRLQEPSEKTLLTSLLKEMKQDRSLAVYTHQIARIEDRIQQLTR